MVDFSAWLWPSMCITQFVGKELNGYIVDHSRPEHHIFSWCATSNNQISTFKFGAPIIFGGFHVDLVFRIPRIPRTVLVANLTSVFVAEDTNHPGLTWLRFGMWTPPTKWLRNHENFRRYDWMSSSSWVFCIMLTDWTHGCWCFLFTWFYPTLSSSPKNKALRRLITDQAKLSNKSLSKEILKTALGCCFQETAPWFLTLRLLSHRSCSWLGNSSQNSEYLHRSLSYLWWTVLSQPGDRGCCNIPSI